jgi:capsular exopolysaccharide synthesis family protein
MSEIYGWLKRTERERSKGKPFDPAILPMGFQTVLQREQEDGQQASSMEDVPVRPVWGSAGMFDLSTAQPELREVIDPQTMVGEQFRVLRSKLSLMQKQRSTKLLLVTSTVPREGKTFTACGLAGVLAHEPGRRVVLIDGDLRKPTAGRKLGMNQSDHPTGLSSVLRGDKPLEESLYSSTELDFCFLPAGPIPRNPSELISSPLLESTLTRLAENFDWVVIDSPPVLGLADTPLLASHCDGVLLVVQADGTPSKLVLESIQRIGRDRICGVVMNRVKSLSAQYYYRYYHSTGPQ